MPPSFYGMNQWFFQERRCLFLGRDFLYAARAEMNQVVALVHIATACADAFELYVALQERHLQLLCGIVGSVDGEAVDERLGAVVAQQAHAWRSLE